MKRDVFAKVEWDETWHVREEKQFFFSFRLLLHSAIPALSRLLLYTANVIPPFCDLTLVLVNLKEKTGCHQTI